MQKNEQESKPHTLLNPEKDLRKPLAAKYSFWNS